MPASIDLNRQAQCLAVEVEDVPSHRMLSAELPSAKPPAPNPSPDSRLGWSLILAHVARMTDGSGTFVVHEVMLKEGLPRVSSRPLTLPSPRGRGFLLGHFSLQNVDRGWPRKSGCVQGCNKGNETVRAARLRSLSLRERASSLDVSKSGVRAGRSPTLSA